MTTPLHTVGAGASALYIADAQLDLRRAHFGNFAGSLVAALLWAAGAFVADALTPRAAMLLVAFGGAFIFPGAVLLLRALGQRAVLAAGNPLGALAR